MSEMTYQDAHQHLVSNIYAPVFFEKLATDYGVHPATETEAREFLVLAGKLQQITEANEEKQASDRHSFVSLANRSLDRVLGNSGVTSQAVDLEVKQAAAQLSQLPDIRNAALLYQDSIRQLAQ